MQAPEHNNQAFSPVHLSANQLADPLNVLRDFFSDDTIFGHLERLEAWRDCVLADDFYRDMKGSPAGLQYFYKLNACLVEAAYLIKQKGIASCQENNEDIIEPFAGNFLIPKQPREPLAVLKSFFDSRDMSWYIGQLWEWLEHGLSAKAAREFIETADLVFFYESMRDLYEAAWSICNCAGYKDMLQQDNTATSIHYKLSSPVSLYRLSNISSQGHTENIKAVISKIKHKLPSVQAIIDLGTAPSNTNKIFLLVLTADEEKETAQSLCSMLEESCNKLADLTVMVHYAASFISGLSKGHTFFQSALKCPVVYLSGELLLPSLIELQKTSDDCTDCWGRWHTQGENFYAGAEFFIGRKAYDTALFCLHQCVESLLTAIIRVGLGYRINNHNLTRLLTLTLLFTNEFSNVFTDEQLELFEILKSGYINVRYKDNFEADGKAIESLLPIVKLLKDKAAGVMKLACYLTRFSN